MKVLKNSISNKKYIKNKALFASNKQLFEILIGRKCCTAEIV